MGDLPDPPTPAEADLRDFHFMPLDVVRFRDSDLVAFEEPAAIVAAIQLWCASWHNVPAGSLTDDERSLAHLTGYSRGLSAFRKIKAGALRGWTKCADGRLYHAVVAEKVNEAWETKLRQRHRTYGAAIRKHNERNPQDKRETPSFEEWIEAGRPTNVTRDGENGHAKVTRDRASKGTEEKEREENQSTPKPPSAPPSLIDDSDLQALLDACCDASGYRPIQPAHVARSVDLVREWRDAGISFDEIVIPTIRHVIANSTDPTSSLARFDKRIRHEHARKAAQPRANGASYRPPDSPILEVEGEEPIMADIRRDLLDRMGPTVFCLFVNRVRFERVPMDDDPTERRPVRVIEPSGFSTSRLMDSDRASIMRNVARAHGFTDVW